MESHVLRQGNPSGSDMVVRWRTNRGLEFHAIGVGHPFNPFLGPTWAYVLSLDKLTVIDTGVPGTLDRLDRGLHVLGLSIADVKRVIVSHGHADHDGNVPEMADQLGVEVWAHEVYPSINSLDGYRVELDRFGHLFDNARLPEHIAAHMAQYKQERQRLTGTHPVYDGERLGPLTFLHMPGHSPDELCIVADGVVFSGDHVLPEITPHPTTAVVYHDFEPYLPLGYKNGNRSYGLKVYLQSLRRVRELDPDSILMPAHRLFFDSKFNIQGLERAQEIIDHHVERCHTTIDILRERPSNLHAVTRSLFPAHLLAGRGFQLAITEVIAHLELLKEVGDITYQDGTFEAIEWGGTEHFKDVIQHLQPIPQPQQGTTPQRP